MHHHRRRKKRQNYGNRMVEISRGLNGFGFTISGQQPCILSCIVTNSPADLAGLRAGDFLITVNGLNVSKLPHEAVVKLIGNSTGLIRMTIAENYYSDSSDEENISNQNHHRVRPKYPHNKIKINRINERTIDTTFVHKKNESLNDNTDINSSLKHINNNLISNIKTSHNIIHSTTASNNKDINNVSAMVSYGASYEAECQDDVVSLDFVKTISNKISHNPSLEYRAIVGYLGTIEMPKQIATSSKHQTVRSCIRKMRQEKRTPTTILMTILPTCLTLSNKNNILLAKYPANRLSYVSNCTENDNRFFGLVTSAIYADGKMCDAADVIPHRKDIIISNSCHVFVIDTKLVNHLMHVEKANNFKIICTKDPISNICLEFPNNSEYVVNLIRSMYTLKLAAEIDNIYPTNRIQHIDVNRHRQDVRFHPRVVYDAHDLMANSPQPSNHSELTTTSSNSDSGIGFHNDCTNISDRILVVDFPGLQQIRQIGQIHNNVNMIDGCNHNRPSGIINDIPLEIDILHGTRGKPDGSSADSSKELLSDVKINQIPVKQNLISTNYSGSNCIQSNQMNSRLTVRAMPDPKVLSASSIRCQLIDKVNNLNEVIVNESHYEAIYPSEIWLSGKTLDECGNLVEERSVDVPRNNISSCDNIDFSLSENIKNNLLATRSTDDIMMNNDKDMDLEIHSRKKQQMSIDDITLLSETNIKTENSTNDKHLFVLPKPIKKHKKILKSNFIKQELLTPSKHSSSQKINTYNKLSPKVFGVPGPLVLSFENLTNIQQNMKKRKDSFSIWGSMQDLRETHVMNKISLNILESTYSAPDLRDNLSRQLPATNNTSINIPSPFRRWGQSSFRSRSGESRVPLQRRPSSLAASESDVYTKSVDDDINSTSGRCRSDTTAYDTESYQPNNHTNNITNSVSLWRTSFEKLLEDPAGLHTFAQFLKKEFSAENIYFWTACERYRQIVNPDERLREAEIIFEKHLSSVAGEPVNIDSHAKNLTQVNLKNAEKNLFTQAQKQIFNLMKFDSYPRFIRSDFYKNCLDAESNKQPLPYPADQLDVSLRTGTISTPSKLKKSLSNAEDRRRKSLLPWHRKTRCKSKDRGEEGKQQHSGINSNHTLKVFCANSSSDIHSSRSSLSSFDAAFSRSGDTAEESSRSTLLCRVILADGATTIVQTKNNESIRDLVERLLEKRGFTYQAFEAYLSGSNKPIDLDISSSTLAGKEVQIEQRVIFKLDLPNRKVISVKSKPCKALGDVLRPILNKYNYRLESVQVFVKDSNITNNLDILMPVTMTDGQRLQIVCTPTNDDPVFGDNASVFHTSKIQPAINFAQVSSQLQSVVTENITPSKINNVSCYGQQSILKITGNSNYINNKSSQQNTLDEITNKVFNELLQGKVETHLGQVNNPTQRPSDQGSIRSDDWGSETSSGIFGRLKRRDSGILSHLNKNIKPTTMHAVGNVNAKLYSKSSNGGSEDGNEIACNNNNNNNGPIKKPLIAKWKAGVKLQVTTRSENQELLEGLKRAQRSRLEDQRGTEINFELPDFLKDKENITINNKLRKLKQCNLINENNSINVETTAMNKINFLESALAINQSMAISNDNSKLNANTANERQPLYLQRPQPAPRLSITSKTGTSSNSNQSACLSLSDQQATTINSPKQASKQIEKYEHIPSIIPETSENGCNLTTPCIVLPTKDIKDCLSPINSCSYNNNAQNENYADTTMIFNHHHHHYQYTQNKKHEQASLSIISSSRYDDTTDNLYNNENCCESTNLDNQLNTSCSSSGSSNSTASNSSTNNNKNAEYISCNDDYINSDSDLNQKGPPPLPPKPKILPIKPSNWGHSNMNSVYTSSQANSANTFSVTNTSNTVSNENIEKQLIITDETGTFKVPQEVSRRILNDNNQSISTNNKTRNIYLDQSSSSFV